MRLFERTKRKPILNLTPLIDILFILIIFFVVSSKIIDNQGVGVVLPESDQGQEQPVNLPVLTMTSDQQLRLNDAPVSQAELAPALLRLKDPRKTLILKIDERIPHGTVIELMDLVKSSGFQKIAFGTESPSSLSE